jgi:hypothetical protein
VEEVEVMAVSNDIETGQEEVREMGREFQIEKEWQSSGLPCVVLMTEMGHRCGYVGVPKGHRWFGASYDDVRGKDGEWMEVHGGLTFGNIGDHAYPSATIDKNIFWFGFDCAHLGDFPDYEWLNAHNPKLAEIRSRYSFERDGTVKDLAYCVVECESLAKQLKESNDNLFSYLRGQFKRLIKWIWSGK